MTYANAIGLDWIIMRKDLVFMLIMMWNTRYYKEIICCCKLQYHIEMFMVKKVIIVRICAL